MSDQLWGIDCIHPDCVHDTARGFRLRFALHRGILCARCHRSGAKLPPVEAMVGGEFEHDWYRCGICADEWRTIWMTERNDMVFRIFQRDAAYGQMNMLGVAEPGLGNFHVAAPHPTIPPAYDERRLILTEEPLPKSALYFRWRPLAGERLTPDKVLQCIFPPNATAVERRNALVRRLLPEEFLEITQVNDGSIKLGVTSTWSKLRCHHCARPIPLRALSTQTLRQVEIGD